MATNPENGPLLFDHTQPEVVPPEASQDFGATCAIFRLGEELGWTKVFQYCLRKRRHDFDVIGNLKVMVANRLLDPLAKLHILDWMEGVYFPGLDREQVDYNHLRRTLDVLISHKEELEPQLARPILNWFDNPLDLVFYDLTSCYFEIDQLSEDNLEALSEAQLDYIVSRPLRRNLTAQKVLGALAPQIRAQINHWRQAQTPLEKRQAFFEVTLEGRRFVVAHQDDIARQTKKTRQRKLIKATAYITERIARTVM